MTASLTLVKKWFSPMRVATPLRRRLSCKCTPDRADPEGDAVTLAMVDDLVHGACP